MINWFTDKEQTIDQTINAAMAELEYLTMETEAEHTANYWIDDRHNIFAFVQTESNGEKYIELHFELYDETEEIIGDLTVANTEDTSKESLLEEVKAIVKMYFGE